MIMPYFIYYVNKNGHIFPIFNNKKPFKNNLLVWHNNCFVL